MTSISIQKCEDYQLDNVRHAICEAINRLGLPEDIIRKDERVLLKINNVGPYTPDKAATTHPAVVEALIDFVFQKQAVPIVCDGPISIPKKKSFIVSGIEEVCSRKGVSLIDFRSHGIEYVDVPIKNGKKIDTILLPRIVSEIDAIINIPKFKTHDLTQFTGAVKNLFGFTHFYSRQNFHRNLRKEERFSEMLSDIYLSLENKIRLCVMDAIIGMEADGPIHGIPRPLGLIIASQDSVAVDAISTYIIGLDPKYHSSTRILLKRRGENPDMRKLCVFREKIESLPIKNFILPKTTIKFSRVFRKVLPQGFLIFRPFIEIKDCTLCGTCVNNCPAGALFFGSHGVALDSGKCVECYCCMESCEAGAIRMEGYLLKSRSLYNTVRSLKKLIRKLVHK